MNLHLLLFFCVAIFVDQTRSDGTSSASAAATTVQDGSSGSASAVSSAQSGDGAQSVSQCPGINEEPTTCVPCEESCRYRLKRSDIACSSVCNAGCRCVDGFYRLDSGECVPVDQCSPPQCYENEYHDTCGPYCEESCATMNNTCQVCLSRCVEGCFCQPGFVRDRYGLSCVTPDQCPQPECDRFEHFETCPNVCPLETCRAKLERAECSSLQCCEPQCRCDPGHLRNDSGECIPEEYCEVDY